MPAKQLLTILFLLSTGFLFSQENISKAPDYISIKKKISDKNSNLYYPALLKKLAVNDTLITDDEYQHLYYGYTLQPEYNPYGQTSEEEEIIKYYKAEKLEEKDYDKFIKLANQSLKEFPLDLRLMNYLAYIYHLKGDNVTAKKISTNFHGIFNAILSSGDGLKCETGIHVISVGHEYVLLNLFQLENVSQSLIGDCDFLAFEKDKYKVPGLYFNISVLTQHLNKKFGEK